MKQHKLDEDGLASSYLMLTVLAPTTIYLIYSLFRKKPVFKCNCRECSSKKQKYDIPRIFVASLLVLIISYLCKNIFTIKINKGTGDFDPFTILNVTHDSSFSEIKKNYRKMLKVFNKKLNRKNMKEEATEGIKNLNKAFTILKDPESLNKWLDNGSTKELMIAMPSFILRFSNYFLVAYIMILVVCIPSFFLLKYFNFKKISSSGSEYESNEKFYEEVDNISELPSIIPNQLILLLGRSNEFKKIKWAEKLPADIVSVIEMKHHIPVMDDCEGYHRILGYLTREMNNKKDKDLIRKITINLIESFKKIAFAKSKQKVFSALLTLEKMINQVIPHPSLYRMQYPGIDMETAQVTIENDKKDISSDEVFLEKVLKGRQFEIAANVLKSVPVLNVSDVNAFTIETSVDNCDFDHENRKIIKKEGECFVLPKDSAPYVQFKLTSNRYSPICHVPHSESAVFNRWTIYLKVNNSIEENFTVIDAFDGFKVIKMSLPYGSSKQDVKINVISNGYFGNDATSSLNIKYI